MNRLIARNAATIALVVAALTLQGHAGAQQQVSVVVNGQTMSFDQPPIVQDGRVFVPLRGVFERLGASVVYANGRINATGNGRNVSLTIGSTQATVNGQPQTLDVAPFVVGERTLVPLRFVAQALGATVNWNDSNSTVVIASNGSGYGGRGYDNGNAAPPNRSFYLTNRRPSGTVNTLEPSIHANFSEPIRERSLHVSIDGQDVTDNVYTNPNGFDLAPPSSLGAGSHRVDVSGVTQAGAAFNTHWSFEANGAVGENFLRNVVPAPNSEVPPVFTFSGRTAPDAHVRVVASGAQSAFGGLFQIGTDTYQTEVQADARGYFAAQVSLNRQVAHVRVVIQSIAPDGSSVERSYTYQV